MLLYQQVGASLKLLLVGAEVDGNTVLILSSEVVGYGVLALLFLVDVEPNSYGILSLFSVGTELDGYGILSSTPCYISRG